MAINYAKYIDSTGTHYIANSGSDENKTYHGGKAGDQTGHEWELKAWYSRPWTVVLRYPNPAVGMKIAELSIAAALNNHIGYDQWQRYTYWDALVKANYDPSAITTDCEEDCTAGVTANVKAVGALMGIPALANIAKDTRSTNMRSRFVAAGFIPLTDAKYTQGYNYLLPGDILLYENHHAAANITYGKYAAKTDVPSDPAPAGLKYGDEGSDVREMQRKLMRLGYDLPKYGADGDFGSETLKALKDFQQDHGLTITGVYDKATQEAVAKALDKRQWVEITGGTVNIRKAPDTNSDIIGVAQMHNRLPYQGETRQFNDRDWYLVEYANQNGWVSSKYSRVV